MLAYFLFQNVKVSPNDGFLVFVHCSQAAFGVADGLYALTAHGFDDPEAVKNVFKFRIWVSLLVLFYFHFLSNRLVQSGHDW